MFYVVACDKCGECLKVCPNDAFYDAGDKYQIEPDYCIECGYCTDVCPYGGIWKR